MPYNEQIFVTADGETTTEYVPRDTLRRVSTPQAYRFDKLLWAYEKAFSENVDNYDILSKQFLNVNDKPVIIYTLEGFQRRTVDAPSSVTKICSLYGKEVTAFPYCRHFTSTSVSTKSSTIGRMPSWITTISSGPQKPALSRHTGTADRGVSPLEQPGGEMRVSLRRGGNVGEPFNRRCNAAERPIVAGAALPYSRRRAPQ